MKYIGIDFGDKRVGISECDETELLAGAVCTLTVNGIEDAANQAAEKISQLNGRAVVLGLPKNMDGTEGYRAQRTRNFAELIREKTGLEVFFNDERLTTVEAYTYMNITGLQSSKRKGKIDALSAQIILQSFLDAKKKHKN